MKLKKIISMVLCCVIVLLMMVCVNATYITIPTDNLTVNTGTIYPEFAITDGNMVYSYTVTDSNGTTISNKKFEYQLYSDPYYGNFIVSSAGKYKITWTVGGYSLVVVSGKYNCKPTNTNVRTYYQYFSAVGETIETTKPSFSNKTFVYDGTEKYIMVENVPSGSDVKYGKNGDLVVMGSKTPFKTADVGVYDLLAWYELPSSSPYADGMYVQLAATLTILPKTLDISNIAVQDKTYNGTNTATITYDTLNGVIDGDDVTAKIPTTGTFASANAGNNLVVSFPSITLSGADANNYKLSPIQLIGSIYPAPISIRAKDIQIIKGQSIPSLEYEIINGQLFGDDKITGTLSTSATSSVAGEYDINQGSLSVSSNYNIVFEKGKLYIDDHPSHHIRVFNKSFANNNCQFDVNILSNTELDGVIYAGIYNSKDILISLKQLKVSDADKNTNIPFKIKTPEEPKYIKIFLFENATSFKPIADSYKNMF